MQSTNMKNGNATIANSTADVACVLRQNETASAMTREPMERSEIMARAP